MVDAALEKKMDTPSVIDALKTSSEAIPHVSLFTDGACSGNPGPGGWGVVFILGEYTEDNKEAMIEDLFGGDGATTNNRMEMMAAIQGLNALPKRCRVDLYTDSTYVRDGLKAWMPNWKKNGWMTADKKPVKNKDLWEELDHLQTKHDITWHWVKGHAGHPMNERADDLARSAVVMQAFKKI